MCVFDLGGVGDVLDEYTLFDLIKELTRSGHAVCEPSDGGGKPNKSGPRSGGGVKLYELGIFAHFNKSAQSMVHHNKNLPEQKNWINTSCSSLRSRQFSTISCLK